jgi:hypothetical protein
LGTLGDPADLIVCKTTTMQGAAVRSAAPFRFGFAEWNNASRDVLMSDKPALNEPADKNNPEDSMPTARARDANCSRISTRHRRAGRGGLFRGELRNAGINPSATLGRCPPCNA